MRNTHKSIFFYFLIVIILTPGAVSLDYTKLHAAPESEATPVSETEPNPSPEPQTITATETDATTGQKILVLEQITPDSEILLDDFAYGFQIAKDIPLEELSAGKLPAEVFWEPIKEKSYATDADENDLFYFKYNIRNESDTEIFYLWFDWLKFEDRGNFLNCEIMEVMKPEMVSSSRTAYRIRIPSGNTCELIIKKSIPAHWVFKETLHSERSFYKRQNARMNAITAIIAILIAMLVYNLFITVIVKQPVYILYSLYILFALIYNILFTGFYTYWVNQVTDFTLTGVVYFYVSYFLLFFFVSFLNLKPKQSRYLKWIYYSYLVYVPLASIVLIYMSIGQVYPSKFRLLLPDYTGLLSHIAFIAILTYSLIKRKTGAFIVAAAFIVYLSGMITYILNTSGFLPSNVYTDNASQIGSVIEVLLFSIALAYRINQLRKDKEQAQSESIQALKQADRTKDEFLRTVAHELRSPLQAIQSLSEGLLAKPLPVNLQSDLHLIRTGSMRLAGLVSNITDYGRIRHTNFRIQKQDFLLYPLAHRVLEINRLMAGESIALDIDMPENLAVHADPERIEQVLQNLVVNAIRATDNGSIRITAGESGGTVTVAVADTGRGIPPDKIEAIFQPYESMSQRGVGLGLTISVKLLELHSSKLEAESKQGKGSVFRFELEPAKAGSIHAPAIATTGQSSEPAMQTFAGTETVLIIDDDRIGLRAIESLLKSAGFRTVTYSDATQALAYLKENESAISAVLSDVAMPGLDGLTFTQQIREFSNIPLILLSGRTTNEDFIRGINTGANDYLARPVNASDLIARVATQIKLHELQNQLRKEKEKVSTQRQSIFRDLHDHFGSGLADISVIIDRLGKDPNINSVEVESLRLALNDTRRALRNRLGEIEDLQLLDEDFVFGLQSLLLRRYSAAGRTISFKCSESAKAMIEASQEFKTALFHICTEIVTNDLKYGPQNPEASRSTWRFRVSKSGALGLVVSTQTSYNFASLGTGNGTQIMKSRLAEAGGHMQMRLFGHGHGERPLVIRVLFDGVNIY